MTKWLCGRGGAGLIPRCASPAWRIAEAAAGAVRDGRRGLLPVLADDEPPDVSPTWELLSLTVSGAGP